ncbi:MAG: phospholipase A [Gammaproteobacteria bacterium]|nr:phospholipase A [Gammaproteobacteria bacterium]MBU1969428.1 phospholipase A [Gammaproteobacteria bacterium]
MSHPNYRDTAILCAFLVASSLACSAQAEPCHDNGGVRLEAHEPNRMGITVDNDDDDWFVDFKLSVHHPILYETLTEGSPSRWLPYFAFTGRFGYYIPRPSTPVVSKSFNPKLFIRYFWNTDACNRYDPKTEYIDFELGHLSNGQSIETLQSYNAHAAALGNSEYADDYISRGWDYWGISGKNLIEQIELRYSLKSYVNGYIQSTIEENFSWEPAREISKFNQVSGVHLAAKYRYYDSYYVGVNLDTGSNHPFRNNTWEANWGAAKLFGIPFVAYYRTGYNSDLARYYNKVTSYGFALEFDTFKQTR